MFNLFRRKRTNSSNKPVRGPGETIRKADLEYLKQWANDRAMIEAFVEPETLVNEMSVVLVDVTGYPPRMRQKIERDRLLKKREEQRKRREKFERGET